VGALAVPAVAHADTGFQGPAYPTGSSGSPTSSKPESKLWFNDGFWWAIMFRNVGGDGQYLIHRFNRRAQTWVNTGVLVDARDSTRQDVLSVGGKLFVASHKFVPIASEDTTPDPADSMRLTRFSYNAVQNAYTPDGPFSVIDSQKSETLVIDRDLNGFLWATWTQEAGGAHHVFVERTTGNCVGAAISACDWGSKVELDSVGTDDISSIIRFGTRVGVMWSDTAVGAGFMRFSFHDDGAAETAWSTTEDVIGNGANPKIADDHINLKVDGSGRVYAVTKTKFISAANPGIILHRRSAGPSGTWSHFPVSQANLHRTRPIVLLDPQHNRIRVYEADGGTIHVKSSPMGSPNFAEAAVGTTAIADTGSTVGNPTSTKQNVSNASQLVVLASNDATNRYWHAYTQIVPCISGNGSGNTIVGTAGNDRLCGLGGNDSLRGLGGNDRLVGGLGRDSMDGGPGNDTLIARDAFKDFVAGGLGFDRAHVNASDVRRSIERLF
jgi:hypothetical protein